MDFLDVLKKLAPTAATLLGGPLAGMAVTAIGEALGVSEPTQQKIAKAITNGQLSGEQVVAIRAAEDALVVKLRELDIKAEELVVGDRKDARGMYVATRARTPAWLSWTIVGAALFLEGWILMYGVPPNADPVIIGRILGTLDAALITVITFWLGSAHNQAAPKAV
jgi:hypothetical protein